MRLNLPRSYEIECLHKRSSVAWPLTHSLSIIILRSFDSLESQRADPSCQIAAHEQSTYGILKLLSYNLSCSLIMLVLQNESYIPLARSTDLSFYPSLEPFAVPLDTQPRSCRVLLLVTFGFQLHKPTFQPSRDQFWEPNFAMSHMTPCWVR